MSAIDQALEIMEVVSRAESRIAEIIGLPVEVSFQIDGVKFALNNRKYDPLSVEDIIYMTSTRLRISADQMIGISREREYADARFIAYRLCRQFIPLITLRQIADAFKRDHSTVLYGINTLEDLLITEPGMKTKYLKVEQDVIDRLKKDLV